MLELAPDREAELRQVWRDWIRQRNYHVCGDLTFRRSYREPFAVKQAFERALLDVQVDAAVNLGLAEAELDPETGDYRLRGPLGNALKKRRIRPHWALAVEPHADGTLHGHVVIQWDPKLVISAEQFERFWRRHYGIARASIPRSQAKVVSYLIKGVATTSCLYMN